MTGIAKFQRMNNVLMAKMPGMVFKSCERLAIPGAWCNYLATKELQIIDFETRVEPAPVAIPVTQDSHYWILNHKLKVNFYYFSGHPWQGVLTSWVSSRHSLPKYWVGDNIPELKLDTNTRLILKCNQAVKVKSAQDTDFEAKISAQDSVP